MASTTTGKYSSKLKDVRVLIIGGTAGIGFGVAEALLELGASSIIVSSSSADRVAKATQRLKDAFPAATANIQGVVCNLGDPETLESQVRQLFAEVSKGGKLDHVIYTAGDALTLGDIETFSLDAIRQAGQVRFYGPLVVAQHLRQHLKGGTGSSYIITTGGGTQRPMHGWAVMMPYLAGLEGLNTALAKDLAPIRVNLVGLGPVDTEMWDDIKAAGKWEEFETTMKDKTLTREVGRVEDVVECYLYLMKDRNMTGGMVNSNAGFLIV